MTQFQMHLGGIVIRHLCGFLNNFPSPPLSEVQSLLVLIFVLACFTAGYGTPHPPHVLSPDDIIRHAGEAQAQLSRQLGSLSYSCGFPCCLGRVQKIQSNYFFHVEKMQRVSSDR